MVNSGTWLISEPTKCRVCGEGIIHNVLVATGPPSNPMMYHDQYRECNKCGDRPEDPDPIPGRFDFSDS